MSCPSKFNGAASCHPILNATPSHRKMDTQLIYDKCMLPLHPFWLISYQGNGSRDIVLFLCFPESERSVFSASAHRYLNVWWLEGVPCFSGLLWRWLDLKCASCEPKPFFLFMLVHTMHHTIRSVQWCDIHYMFVFPSMWSTLKFKHISDTECCLGSFTCCVLYINKLFDIESWLKCKNLERSCDSTDMAWMA